MKLCLIAITLLLVPFVLADQRPANKVLYDDDWVIAEGFDLKDFEYAYYDGTGNFLRFETMNNKSSVFREVFHIKGDPRKQNLSFALESFPYVEEPDKSEDKIFCRKNSSENLQHLIDWCDNTIRIRDLTEDERDQLRQFKNERRGKETPYFKAVYKNNAVITKSVGIDNFIFYNSYRFEVISYQNRTKAEYMIEHDKAVHLPTKSFVVESVPANRTHDCHRTDMQDLKPYFCEGQIQLRSLKADD